MPISATIIMPFAQVYNKLNRVWNIMAYVSLLVASYVSGCNLMNICVIMPYDILITHVNIILESLIGYL